MLTSLRAGDVSGFVHDAQSGESIIGVNVFVRASGQGAATNVEGFFVLRNGGMGQVDLTFSHIAYVDTTLRLTLGPENFFLPSITLNPHAIDTKAIEVVAKRTTIIQDMDISSMQVDPIILSGDFSISIKLIYSTATSNLAELLGTNSGSAFGALRFNYDALYWRDPSGVTTQISGALSDATYYEIVVSRTGSTISCSLNGTPTGLTATDSADTGWTHIGGNINLGRYVEGTLIEFDCGSGCAHYTFSGGEGMGTHEPDTSGNGNDDPSGVRYYDKRSESPDHGRLSPGQARQKRY